MTFLSYEYSSLNSGQWLPGIFLPQIFWLCSLFVHLDPEKHFNSFLLLYWFLLCMEMALEDLHIPKLLTEIHIRMHVCTKSFSRAHFPTFTLHQTKA